MANLLEETKDILEEKGLSINDIKWVGTRKYRIGTEDFLTLANVFYDDGYGAPEVATDLIVVGEYWWLERHEYDGAEWWEFKTFPPMPEKEIKVRTLIGGMWDTLEQINKEVEDG